MYMGLLPTKISVHGHLYTITDPNTLAPLGLLPLNERLLNESGQPGRNPELWKWTKQRAQEESESSRQARDSKNWRSGAGKKQGNKDRAWGNSRLRKW